MFDEDKRQVEYRIVNDEIWLCLQRKTIAGSAQSLFEKIDMLLDAHLKEQRQYERMDDE